MNIDNPLEEAVQFIRAGQKPAGRRILVALLKDNPRDEKAWIWLAYAMDTPEESLQAIHQYLKINPDSQAATQALKFFEAPAPLEPQDLFPAADLSLPDSNLVEKTQPVKVPPANPNTGADGENDVNLSPGAAEPISSQKETEARSSQATPHANPRKRSRFGSCLILLAGSVLLAALLLLYWLWANGILILPPTGGILRQPVSANSTAIPPNPSPSVTSIPQPTPTLTLPPALWDVDQLPVISSANAARLGRLIAWPEKGAIAFSQDWMEMAVFDGETIQIWDVPHHSRISKLSEAVDQVTDMGYLPGARLLVTASMDQRVNIFDTHTGQRIRELSFDRDTLTAVEENIPSAYSTATSLEISEDGKYIGAATYGLAAVWEAASGALIQVFKPGPADLETLYLEGPDAAIEIRISPDHQTAAYRMVGKITLMELQSGDEVQTLLAPGSLGIQFSPDGSALLESGDGYVVLWNLESGQNVLYIKGNYNSDYAANTAAFSPDGNHLAVETAGETGVVEVQIWNLDTRQVEATLGGFTSRLNTLDYSADGRLLAGGGSEGVSRVWNVQDGTEIVQFEGLNSLIFSKNGKELAGFRNTNLEILGADRSVPLLGVTPTPIPTLTPTGTPE